MKILVVAAYDPELAAIRAAISPGWSDRLATCAVGIGFVKAAFGAAEAIREHAPDRVVLVGTCGAYPGGGRAVGDVSVPTMTVLADTAVDEGRAAALPNLLEALLMDGQMSAELRGALEGSRASPGAPVTVATTIGITTDDALAASRGTKFQLEHLELGAVAAACARAQIPFAALLGVANRCGSAARAEWLANRAAVEKATGEALLRYLNLQMEN